MGEMQPKSDAQLLREYAESGSEPAFAELVTRHTDLVYSAALRQVPSSDLACDVAQNVFTSLARGARTLTGKLNPDTSLAGWLCRCTRNLALNLRRDDFRRHSRERQAMENLHPSPETAPDWDRLCPMLDEAISGLNEADHDALVLRFFKNQDLRSVGHALGVNDDTAQKRVSRALEKLREYLAHHGITTTGAALAMAISANAVQAAPASLAATISAAAVLAGTTLATTATATVTKIIAMTALQKTLIAATIAAAVGTGIYEACQVSNLRSQVQTLQQQQAPLAEQIQQLQRERDDATNQLAGLFAENARLKSNSQESELLKLQNEVTQLRRMQSKEATDDPFTRSVLALTARAAELNQHLQQMPDKKIPELQLLDASDWLTAARTAKFGTDTDIRKALQGLRSIAKNKVPIGSALYSFARANNGQLPTNLSQLKSYFNTSRFGDLGLDDSTFEAIISRYTLLHTGNVNDFPSNTCFVVETAPVDKDFDSRAKFGLGTSSIISTGIGSRVDPEDESY
jgi:RNA polymerase sigma factor (sigma-70 family)